MSVKTSASRSATARCWFKSRKPLVHRRSDDSLVLAGGKKGEWTSHDLRRTAATTMQALRISPDVIDRCQNHVIAGNKVRRHYLHYGQAEEKRGAASAW